VQYCPWGRTLLWNGVLRNTTNTAKTSLPNRISYTKIWFACCLIHAHEWFRVLTSGVYAGTHTQTDTIYDQGCIHAHWQCMVVCMQVPSPQKHMRYTYMRKLCVHSRRELKTYLCAHLRTHWSIHIRPLVLIFIFTYIKYLDPHRPSEQLHQSH
jgi:hypothetical protein